MPISSLPDVCFSEIISSFDRKTLYKCLFVNRYFCKITIPLIWRDPFISLNPKISSINTLLSCLNEDEISSLIPYSINFKNNKTPLFEYGKYIKKFSHGYCINHIIFWLDGVQDFRIQKLVNVIYHMIMRQGSNLQEFVIQRWGSFYDLPKFSTFTAYEPGITNLRSLELSFDKMDVGYENTIEFLNMVSKFCDGIVNFDFSDHNELRSNNFLESFVDIIKLQPLERIYLYSYDAPIQEGVGKNVIYALESRSGTLKELIFNRLDFRGIDLSFMSKLDCLERLELINCKRYLFTEKLHLKELKLYYYEDKHYDFDYDEFKMTEAKIKPLLNETLQILDFRDIVTPEAVKAVKESCLNLKYLQISFNLSEEFLTSTIPLVCELTSLKILKIDVQFHNDDEDYDNYRYEQLFRLLGDNLKFIECLSFNFDIDLTSFEYFIDNCKADLKKWFISVSIYQNLSRKDFLIRVINYQKVHSNSLKLFGIAGRKVNDVEITNEESEIVDLLKDQGVEVEFYKYDNLSYFDCFHEDRLASLN